MGLIFPDLEDYDTKDFRSLILYAWHFELFGLKELIESTTSSFRELVSKNIKNAQDNIENWEEYDKSMQIVQIYHRITPLAYQSYLLTMFSILEASLDRYCNICEDHLNLTSKFKDFTSEKDKGIRRSVKYLENVVKVEKIKSDFLWGKITVISDLRNDFIHRCGMVGREDKKRKYEEELNVFVVDGTVILTYENMLEIYEYVRRFMEFVFSRNIKI